MFHSNYIEVQTNNIKGEDGADVEDVDVLWRPGFCISNLVKKFKNGEYCPMIVCYCLYVTDVKNIFSN